VNLTDGEIAKKVEAIFDMRPYFEQRLKLRNPIYSETAAYGHMGRTARNSNKKFLSSGWTKTVSRVIYMGEIDFVDQNCFWIVIKSYYNTKKAYLIELNRLFFMIIFLNYL
jgi:hypothetical protein